MSALRFQFFVEFPKRKPCFEIVESKFPERGSKNKCAAQKSPKAQGAMPGALVIHACGSVVSLS